MSFGRAFATVLASAALAAEGTAQEPAHLLPGVETSRVVLEARVTDGRGRALAGLGARDFRLEVDGRAVPLESVVWVDEAKSARADRTARASGTSGHAPLEGPRGDPTPPGRLLVLLFQKDFDGSRLSGLLGALRQAKEILAPLTPRDRVAVLTFDSHLRLHLDFTADIAAIGRVLDESVLLRWPGPLAPSDPPSLAAHLDGNAALEASSPEQALLAIGRALEAIPGTKTVLLFGYGLGQLRGGTLVLDHEYGEARAALEKARAAVFCLDVTEADWHSLEFGLRRVAEDTGGEYFRLYGSTGAALTRVAAALSGHYVLAFERPEGGRGEHRVRLALDGRRGTVLTRSRYVD